LAAYAVLAVAAVPLHQEEVRLALWVLTAGLSVKSVLAYLKHR